LRHVAPNVFPQLATFGLLGIGIVVIIEGALSFLGLGVAPPAPSWGNMIAQGQESLAVTPALVLLPSGALFVTVLSCNLLGEALRARCGDGPREGFSAIGAATTAGEVSPASIDAGGWSCTPPLLEVRDLCIGFGPPEERKWAVQGLRYTLEAGRTLAII